MKAEYVNPFLAPAQNVWQRMLNQELDLDEYATMSEQVTTEDITAIIRVKGLIEGHVLYGFDIETAKAVASVMMEEEVEEFDEIALSALGELANVISGNAATELSSAGFYCQISPPQILQAPGFRYTDTNNQQILVVFDSDLGPLHVRIDLVERPDDDSLDWNWQQMYKHNRKPR
ncbi:MAG: chemotaxis protein CheX [Chloroflexi bacterium]|nr:chemotaxis protein CheX [Chloroflexota bacterium]